MSTRRSPPSSPLHHIVSGPGLDKVTSTPHRLDKSPAIDLRRRLPLQHHRHSAVRSSIVRIPQQAPEPFLAMRLRPERPSDATIYALAREEQDPAPEHEASSRVRRVGIGNETGRVESAGLRVDVEEWCGPVGG
jgi:hypothetical protein